MRLEQLRVSDDLRRRNPAIFGQPGDAAQAVPRRAGNGAESAHRERRGGTSKTETRFFETFLEPRAKSGEIRVLAQPRIFSLEGGGTYTPDFVAVTPSGIEVYEVKGGYRGPGWEQGHERYKRAALQWACPFIKFTMATWSRKDAKWTIEAWEKGGTQ